jgi:hypothetical protein
VAVENTGAAVRKRALTPAQYGDLADVPPELEWLANITNPKTRRAYEIEVSEFSAFAGLRGPAELRTVTQAHVIAWCKDLEARGLSLSRSGASSRLCLPCSTTFASATPCPAIPSTA